MHNSRPIGRSRISIHALRKESDRPPCGDCRTFLHISIHALRKESDRGRGRYHCLLSYFNPRSP